jgi:hypothetical protein
MKMISMALWFAVSSACLIGQQTGPYLAFDKVSHDFGEIKEADGIVRVMFPFTNTGNAPVIINNVLKKCGCTSPIYPKKPLLPGEKAAIEVGYDPKGRPGPFRTSVNVVSNARNNSVVLELKGIVIGKDITGLKNPLSVEEKYKFNIGPLKTTTNHVAFSKLYYHQSDSQSIGIYNPGQQDVAVSFPKLPGHIGAVVEPEVIPSGKEGVVTFYYDAAQKDDWGFVFDRVIMSVNGTENNSHAISISANIVEDFGDMTPEQKVLAPQIQFEKKEHNFDTVYQNSKVQYKYYFENVGKSDLIIRKIKPSCGCTASHSGSNVVAPGKKSYILAEFNTGGRSGRQGKNITVVTNDPANPMVILKFSSVVVPKD